MRRKQSLQVFSNIADAHPVLTVGRPIVQHMEGSCVFLDILPTAKAGGFPVLANWFPASLEVCPPWFPFRFGLTPSSTGVTFREPRGSSQSDGSATWLSLPHVV